MPCLASVLLPLLSRGLALRACPAMGAPQDAGTGKIAHLTAVRVLTSHTNRWTASNEAEPGLALDLKVSCSRPQRARPAFRDSPPHPGSSACSPTAFPGRHRLVTRRYARHS